MTPIERLFDLRNRVAVITGGGGVLCGAISLGLARLGVKVVVLDIVSETAERVVHEIHAENGEALAVRADVLDRASLENAAHQAIAMFGRVDILINGAGGNNKQATTSPELPFFDLSPAAVRQVVDLNFLGTVLPSQVFGQIMVQLEQGVILNISSMNAYRPLTRIPAYSAAKAAVSNFTQWLAVYMAREFSPRLRVNAIAPGFFLTEQNRFLLTEASGELTARSQSVISHTPLGRFGQPEDLLSTVVWLLSPGASFITGVVVPVDGGFSANTGV